MKVTQALLSEYRKELDREAERARAYFRSAIAEFYRRYPDANTEDTRVFVLDLMGSALPNFLDLTATLACDLFDELADECGFEGEHARLYETTDWQMVDRKVHYLAGFLNDGDRDKFKSEVADLTHYYCKRAAYDNMVKNCQAQKVKWARVPTGLETCAFCFMLASRGFVYQSEEKANVGDHGYHDNCDCVVIPGFQGKDGNPRVKIDGYDPETMYENWLSCARTVGIDKYGDPLQGEWTDDERKAVLREVKTRDWHWLYTGEATRVYFETPELEEDFKTNPERRHEKQTIDLLAANGFHLEIKESSRQHRNRVADSLMAGVKWEFKSPQGNSFLTIKNQLKSDLYGQDHSTLNPQSDKVVISNVRSDMTLKDMERGLVTALDPDQGLKPEELAELSEIMLLDRSGRMRRIVLRK